MRILIVGSKGPHLAAVEAAASHFGETFEICEEWYEKPAEFKTEVRANAFEARGLLMRHAAADLVIAAKCHHILKVPCPLWVIHDSLLPRWRGFAPVAHGLLAGDSTFGCTLFEATSKVDAGPILQQRTYLPRAHESAREIQVGMIPLYYEMVYHQLSGESFGKRLDNPAKGATIGQQLNRELLAKDYDVRKKT